MNLIKYKTLPCCSCLQIVERSLCSKWMEMNWLDSFLPNGLLYWSLFFNLRFCANLFFFNQKTKWGHTRHRSLSVTPLEWKFFGCLLPKPYWSVGISLPVPNSPKSLSLHQFILICLLLKPGTRHILFPGCRSLGWLPSHPSSLGFSWVATRGFSYRIKCYWVPPHTSYILPSSSFFPSPFSSLPSTFNKAFL